MGKCSIWLRALKDILVKGQNLGCVRFFSGPWPALTIFTNSTVTANTTASAIIVIIINIVIIFTNNTIIDANILLTLLLLLLF